MHGTLKFQYRDSISPRQEKDSLKSQTINNRGIRVIGNTIVAQPFESSSAHQKSRKGTMSASPYGLINTVLNPPNSSFASTYKTDYNNISRTHQSAGIGKKRLVPYSMTAARNTLNNEQKRFPPPFQSTLKFDSGIYKPLNPFLTTKAAADAPTLRPMEARVGFNNPDIAAGYQRRFHAAMTK